MHVHVERGPPLITRVMPRSAGLWVQACGCTVHTVITHQVLVGQVLVGPVRAAGDWREGRRHDLRACAGTIPGADMLAVDATTRFTIVRSIQIFGCTAEANLEL